MTRSTRRAIDLVTQIAGAGIRSLRFTGGEPLLRKDLFHVLRQANTSSFKRIILQTNGLLLKKLHEDINASPITNVSVSIDGLKDTNDHIRGIRGYFDLAMEGIKLLRNKQVSIAITLNRISASELGTLADVARSVGAGIDLNILSRSLFFLQDADIASMWPERKDVLEIAKFLRDRVKRPAYEVDYITRYYNQEKVAEPPLCSRIPSGLRAIEWRCVDRLLPSQTSGKYPPGQPCQHLGVRSVLPPEFGDDPPRMSGLYVRH